MEFSSHEPKLSQTKVVVVVVILSRLQGDGGWQTSFSLGGPGARLDSPLEEPPRPPGRSDSGWIWGSLSTRAAPAIPQAEVPH